FVALVHVMRNGAEIIEELAVHRPAPVTVPNRGPNQAVPFRDHGVAERKGSLAFVYHVTEPFVRRRALVGRGRGGREPAFVDAAAMCTQGIKILWRQFD